MVAGGRGNARAADGEELERERRMGHKEEKRSVFGACCVGGGGAWERAEEEVRA